MILPDAAASGILIIMESPEKAPNCLKCEYFFVSWDSRFPRGCRIFGIKSMNLPSREVFISTGLHCPSFKESAKIKKEPLEKES